MGNLAGLFQSTKRHLEATDLPRGNFKANLNVNQTREAASFLERIAAGYIAEAGPNFVLPTREAFLLGILEMVAEKAPEGGAVSPRVNEFVQAILFPAKEERPEGEAGSTRRRKVKKTAKKKAEAPSVD